MYVGEFKNVGEVLVEIRENFGDVKETSFTFPEREQRKLEKKILKGKLKVYDIQITCEYILNHLKLPTGMMSYEIDTSFIESVPPATFTPKGSMGGVISFNVRKTYTFDNVLSILIHECMHYYVFMKNKEYYRVTETYQQEVVTDFLATYFGFYKQMYFGYSKAISKRRCKFYGEDEAILGYVSADDFTEFKNLMKLM